MYYFDEITLSDGIFLCDLREMYIFRDFNPEINKNFKKKFINYDRFKGFNGEIPVANGNQWRREGRTQNNFCSYIYILFVCV